MRGRGEGIQSFRNIWPPMRPAKPIRMIQHVRQKRHRIQTMGSQTSTPTPKLILPVATRAGKKEKLFWRKKNELRAYSFVMLLMGVQFSLHAINKILFQTHFLPCKCHPGKFSVINNPSLIELA